MANANQHFPTFTQRVTTHQSNQTHYQINKQKIKRFFRLRFHLGHWKRRDIWGSDEILA